jgi:outer membrane protein
MKRSVLQRFLPARALLAGLALGLSIWPASAAEIKVAAVNLRSVFDAYWRTRQADIQLRDRASDFEKTRKGMVDEHQKANEEYHKLIDSASDSALSAEERERRKKDAESKLRDIREIEQNIGQLERTRDTTLRDQQARMRNRILGDIREVITRKARDGNYTLVIDVSAESINNNTQIILYNAGTPDLSEEILTQLNSTAPAGALPGVEKPDESNKDTEKKDEKKKE